MDKNGNKTGGRKKGTPNKSSKFSKDLINDLLNTYKETGKFSRDFEQLEPKDRINVAIKMLQFVLPVMKAVDANVKTDTKMVSLADKLKALGCKNEQKPVPLGDRLKDLEKDTDSIS